MTDLRAPAQVRLQWRKLPVTLRGKRVRSQWRELWGPAQMWVECRKLMKTDSAADAVADLIEKATNEGGEGQQTCIKKEKMNQLHGLMDKSLQAKEDRMQEAKQQGDTTRLGKR